ncbi:hypothetical protein, partial [Microcystis sp. M113S1]|uniref:hypothetical protein n=1 Tax=Microcystis sp. M113S1 TaxID=2771104 RepID=UPI00258FC77B
IVDMHEYPQFAGQDSSGVGWVERNNTGAKMAQFAGKSATQPPQRLLLISSAPISRGCFLLWKSR